MVERTDRRVDRRSGNGSLEWLYFEHQLLPELRVAGAPMPCAFFHWEGPPGEEQWVDFITPDPMLFAGSNIFILALLSACPVGLVFWLRRKVPLGSGEPLKPHPDF